MAPSVMRTPWWTSYFSLMPRRIEIVSSTVGSLTKTGWKRRASAASFSMCLRYSSSVVAPTQCNSPRAFGLARAHQCVKLVDEDDDLAFGGGDLLENRL